jgi:hypothetical protein
MSISLELGPGIGVQKKGSQRLLSVLMGVRVLAGARPERSLLECAIGTPLALLRTERRLFAEQR